MREVIFVFNRLAKLATLPVESEGIMNDADYRKLNDRTQNSSTYHKKDGTPVRAILKRDAQAEIDEAGEQDGNPYAHSTSLLISVRTGEGDLRHDGTFSDVVETVSRIPSFNAGWQAVTYKGGRYQLFGGVRTAYFICLNSPIKGRS